MTSHNRIRTIRSRLVPLALLAVFCAVCSANGPQAINSSSSSGNNIISLKLTPRHVELERRRRERRLSDVDFDFDALVEDEPKYRRREEAVQIGALFEGYGTHYVDLWCGTPPQRQTVIVDTGSGVTAFPCSECTGDCGVPDYHVDRLFSEEESSTFRASTCSSNADCIMGRSGCQGKQCKIGMAYAEGSKWNAKEVVDQCYVGGPHETPLHAAPTKDLEGDPMDPKHAAHLAFDMTFGCQDFINGLFVTQLADGIMGMSNQKSTYWSQMYQAGKMGSNRQFALCFSRPDIITKEGTEAGAMTLGGVDTRLHTSPMVFTPSFDNGRSSFFSVKVRRVMLREGKYGESVQSTNKNPNKGVTVLNVEESALNRGGVIVDSGTTDTYWNSAIASEFKKVFKEMTGFAHSNKPMSLKEADVAALPTILFQLQSDFDTNGHLIGPNAEFKTPGLAGTMDPEHALDVILAIPPSHYMEYNPDSKKYTSRFYPGEHGGSVFGANAMMGHDVFFDMETKRIGWAESDCDYTHTIEDQGYTFAIDGELKELEEVGSGGSVKTNNNNDNKPSEPETCEEISGGTKCQKKEGCKWGFGKCTTKAGSAAKVTESPTDMPSSELSESETVNFETEVPAPIEAEEEFADLVDSILDQALGKDGLMMVTIGLVLSIVLCCICCLFCRSNRRSRADVKYSTVDPSIEMTNGGMNGDHQSFQDEPDDDDDMDDIHSQSNGSRSSSQFKDDPEFEGDFA